MPDVEDDGMRAPGGRPTAAGEVRRHLAVAATSLDARPSEIVGLALLLAGGLLCLAVLVWWAPADVRPGPPDGVAPTAPPGADGGDEVVVHVAGAVVRPGIVSLPATARVVDAVAAAGGATVLADLAALNLARTVTDGERIEVPERGSPATGTGSEAPPGGFDAEGRLDLNRATAQELETLPGIGPVLAQRIVEHRAAHGPFTSTGGLREVPGIGERSFQRLADLVVVP